MAFQGWERNLASLLGSNPKLKQFIKVTYQYLNFYMFRERGFQYKATAGCKLQSPESWAGVEEIDSEHLFGYYDKSPWSPDGRHFLLQCLSSRTRNTNTRILALDSLDNRVVNLGKSTAWNFQQGSMLQWGNASGQQVALFNDFEGDDLITRIVDCEGKEISRLPLPVQAYHPDTGKIISINYNLLLDNRVDYAYNALAKNQNVSPRHDGLFLMDLEKKNPELRIPLEWFSKHQPRADMASSNHWLNHAMFSPSGRKLLIMHRWGTGHRRTSRLYCVPVDKGEPTLLLDMDMVSHYSWLDDNRIITYCRSNNGDAYYVVDVETTEAVQVMNPEVMLLGDGHPSISAVTNLVISDTYPDRQGTQQLHAFDPDQIEKPLMPILRVAHSPAFHGDQRCDLHPRWHPTESMIAFDSVLSGKRRCWIVDCGELFTG
jgi:hypothetical protein